MAIDDTIKNLVPETSVRIIFEKDVDVQRFDIIAGQSYYDIICKGCVITETLFMMDDGKKLLFMNGTTGNFFWLPKEGIIIEKL